MSVKACLLFFGLFCRIRMTSGFWNPFCNFFECCDDQWIKPDLTALHTTLSSKLYGQDLAIKTVMKHLKGHLEGDPRKALALSLHGGTGTGKSYTTRMVVDSLFEKGMNSKFVHRILGQKYKNDQERTAKDLRDLIETEIRKCPRSVFIFDAMNHMPPGIIDILKPFLDFYEHLDGVDYRKAIFFILSPSAGTNIVERTLKQWSEGKKRNDITLKEMEDIIISHALNDKSEFFLHSKLITSGLITAFVPFLPLKREHVKQCIRDGFVQKGFYRNWKGVPEPKVIEVMEELDFAPKDAEEIFSTYGCKRVLDQINYVSEEL